MNVHIPVLKQELLSLARTYIDPQEEKALFVDATVGDAGHSLALLEEFPKAKLLALDRDREILDRAKIRLQQAQASLSLKEIDLNKENKKAPIESDPKILLCHASYHRLASFLNKQELKPKFILLDLGVSLFHLKEARRGFSYLDQSLDMRFDPSAGRSAKEIVNHSSPKELARILRDFGEEPYAHRIARMIIKERPFRSAYELAERIRKNLKNKGRAKKIHPATRSFQALRIAVNEELDILQKTIRELPQQLAPGGLLAVIAFHSLEDRIVKLGFKEIGILKQKKSAQDASFLILTQRPIGPSTQETRKNPASRSARLRVLFAQRGT